MEHGNGSLAGLRGRDRLDRAAIVAGPVGRTPGVLLLGTGGRVHLWSATRKILRAGLRSSPLPATRSWSAPGNWARTRRSTTKRTPEWGRRPSGGAGGGVGCCGGDRRNGTLGQSLQALGLGRSSGVLVALGGVSAELNAMGPDWKMRRAIHELQWAARDDHRVLRAHLVHAWDFRRYRPRLRFVLKALRPSVR